MSNWRGHLSTLLITTFLGMAHVDADEQALIPDTAFSDAQPILVAQESMDDLFESDSEPAENPAAPENEDAATSAPTTEASSMDDLFESEPTNAETPTAAVAVARKPAVNVSGFLQNEFAYAYGGDGRFSKFKNIAKLRLSGALSPRVSWQLGAHLQYDPVFEFETFYSDLVEDDQKLDGYVDETFLDIDANAWDIRIGRQHIVWGEMVGLFFADVISPLDLREFVLPDFDLIRIPQWAARAEYFSGDFHGELVYIPYTTIDDLGEFGSEFFPFPIELPAGVQAVFLEDKTPNDPGEDFGAGARASYLSNGWDTSLFYYTSPDKTAAFQREILFGPLLQVFFKPIHERIHQVGATIAKDYGSFVLKAEAIETTDRLISVLDIADQDGLDDSNELRYVIGIDWAGETGHNANVQLFQTWLQDHSRTMIYKELESGLSLYFTTTSWHPKLKPEILWIRSLDRNEWLLETKVSWKFAPEWRGVLGADIFEGPNTGVLGQFDKTDRVYTELRFSF
jgi:hypothetical protein